MTHGRDISHRSGLELTGTPDLQAHGVEPFVALRPAVEHAIQSIGDKTQQAALWSRG